MNDPRSSNDPVLRAALRAWDRASPFRDTEFDEAMRIRSALRDTTSHQAFGWAALTCGRIAAHRQLVDLSEVLLTEALGRFIFLDDKYGEALTVSHLALPHLSRRNLDRALELALRPLSLDIPYSNFDKLLLHNIASQCYWEREESHPAILHMIKAYDLVKNTDDFRRKSVVLGNIGVVLVTQGEWALALSALTEAWRLQLDHCSDRNELQLTHLSNMIHVSCQLENYEAALRHAKLLFDFLETGTYSGIWGMFENMADAFAFAGQIEKAQYCLDRARVLNHIALTPFSKAATQVSEAILLEAKKDFHAAIALAKEILDGPVAMVMYSNHRYAAKVLSRSYSVLGRKREAARWDQFAAEAGREKLLSDILSSQIRTSLNVEQPVEPLTARELTCLSLSAHGQTSADIALKLDIKTRTVNYHFSQILRKLNAMNRQEAIAKASAANLLT